MLNSFAQSVMCSVNFLGKFEIAKVETVKIAFLVGGKSSFPYKLVNFRTFNNSAQFLLRKFHEEKRQTEQVKPPKVTSFARIYLIIFPKNFAYLMHSNQYFLAHIQRFRTSAIHVRYVTLTRDALR